MSIVREDFREYEPVAWELPESEAAALIGERLEERLRKSAPEAEVLELKFETEVTGNGVRVHMLAQCREDIAYERELTP